MHGFAQISAGMTLGIRNIPELMFARKTKHHTRRRNASKDVEDIVFTRDNGLCVYCGNPGGVVDHVVPYSRGGVTDSRNLVTACVGCNALKGGRVSGRAYYMVTRGLYVLLCHGENISWIDDLHAAQTLKPHQRVRVIEPPERVPELKGGSFTMTISGSLWKITVKVNHATQEN